MFRLKLIQWCRFVFLSALTAISSLSQGLAGQVVVKATFEPAAHVGGATSARVLSRNVAWTGLMRTTDGGVHWSELTFDDKNLELLGIPSTGNIGMFPTFVTPTTGWMGVDSGATWKTVDGGVTWALEKSVQATTMTFAEKGLGLMTAWDDASRGLVTFKSPDSGRHWIECGDNAFDGAANIWPPFLLADGNAFVVASGDIHAHPYWEHVFGSTDGGCSWRRIAALGPDQRDSYNVAFFLDRNHGWIGGRESGILLNTSDGGRTWKAVTPEYGRLKQSVELDIEGVYFESLRRGWLLVWSYDVGHAAVLATVDGGRHWTQIDRQQFVNLAPIFNRTPRWDQGMLAEMLLTHGQLKL